MSNTATRIVRWNHEESYLIHTTEDVKLIHPSNIPHSHWIDDMKRWPPVTYKNIFNYLVLSEGVDGEKLENYKSMESHNYFYAGKVGMIFFHEPSAGLCYLKADVTPGQSVNNAKHSAWVLLTSTGVVETVGCTCIAGRGKSCSHAGAILWKLEYAFSTGRSGQSCTDKEQKWNQGTTKNLGPQRLENISFKRMRPGVQFSNMNQQPVISNNSLLEMPAYITQDEFIKAADQSSMSKLFKLSGSMINKAYRVQTQTMHAPQATSHSEHSVEILCHPCKEFFNHFVVIDGKKRSILESKTKKQSSSAVWYDARKVRLTASSAKRVPVRSTTDPQNFLREHIYPSFRGNHATKHGSINEPKALESLREMGFCINSSGTVVSEKDPWLSASPDGVTDDGRLVEVKCPVLCKDENFQDKLKSGLCDVAVTEGKSELQQKGRRGYYMQVQLAMYCTGLKKCIFFIWTENGHLLVDVEYNESYVIRVIERLKHFYFVSLLPRLADDFNDDRLKLSKGYRDIMSN